MPETPKGSVDSPFLYDATDAELEQFIVRAICVAGKNATAQEKKLRVWFAESRHPLTGGYTGFDIPMPMCPSWYEDHVLRPHRIGQYKRISQAMWIMASKLRNNSHWLRVVGRDELCEVPGIGMKTASFFILFTRRGTRMACLDVHVLRWMREQKGVPNVPRQTPQSKKRYLELEARFLEFVNEAARERPVGAYSPAEFDFMLWSLGRSGYWKDKDAERQRSRR